MFVEDWMARDVVTAGPDDPIAEAAGRMRERAVRHLVVVHGGAPVGVLSDRDLKEFSPSSATALDVYELHYLLAKARVREAMRTPVVVAAPETPVEEAALLMLEHRVGSLPVVEAGRLVGIITETDIDRALVDITGARHGGERICVTLDDRPGSLLEVTDLVRAHGFGLRGILTSYEGVPAGKRRVVIRTGSEGDAAGLRGALKRAWPDVRLTAPPESRR